MGSSGSGKPILITFLTKERQNQPQRQQVAKHGMATRSHMNSKSDEKGLLFSITGGFLSLILVFIWLIIEWTMARLSELLGSMDFSICLKRAREPRRPKVDIVVVTVVLSNFIFVNWV